MSLQKNPAFRGGNDVRIDERCEKFELSLARICIRGVCSAYYLQLVGGITVEDSRTFVYPRMFSVHDMPTEVLCKDYSSSYIDGFSFDQSGLPASPSAEVACAGVNRYRLPNIVNLTHERYVDDRRAS
jgi:hypothetical protein